MLETDPIIQLNNTQKLAADFAKIIHLVWITHIIVPFHTLTLPTSKQPRTWKCVILLFANSKASC